jgi:putative flippase GtrA
MIVRWYDPDFRAAAARFLKFAGVGVVGFLVDAIFLHLQVSVLAVSPYAAKLASYLVAATVTWRLNRSIAFPDASIAQPAQQWARFVATNAIGGGVNYGVFATLITVLPLGTRAAVLAVAVGSIAGLVFNFTLSKKLVFTIELPNLRPEVMSE